MDWLIEELEIRKERLKTQTVDSPVTDFEKKVNYTYKSRIQDLEKAIKILKENENR